MALAIGITGGIAAGKTAILKFFAAKGYNCFSADNYVGELYADFNIQQQILQLFPELKTFDKALIAEVIYNDELKRIKLEEMIHPLVAKRLTQFLIDNFKQPIVFLEIPLLFEVGWQHYFAKIIAIICPRAERLKRALARGISEEQFAAIETIQLSDEEKAALADFTLNSNQPWPSLEQELQLLLESFSTTS